MNYTIKFNNTPVGVCEHVDITRNREMINCRLVNCILSIEMLWGTPPRDHYLYDVHIGDELIIKNGSIIEYTPTQSLSKTAELYREIIIKGGC